MTLAAGGSSSRSRATRHGVNHAPADSESDSSGSPCTECNSNQTYRLPVNSHSHKGDYISNLFPSHIKF